VPAGLLAEAALAQGAGHIDGQTEALLHITHARAYEAINERPSVRDPDKITYRATNATFCHSRKILLIGNRNNDVVGSYFPKVSVARVSHPIITAYPSGSQC